MRNPDDWLWRRFGYGHGQVRTPAQQAADAGLTLRRMTGIWRFGLPPSVPADVDFDMFWRAVDAWIDQHTAPPSGAPRIPRAPLRGE